MSEVKRYRQWCHATHGHALSEDDGGELVAYTAYAELEKQLAERDAALARCVEALKPFGKMADPYESFDGQHDFLRNHVVVDHLGTRITVGDFRDARTVLASLPTSAQATAKVLAAARQLGNALHEQNTAKAYDGTWSKGADRSVAVLLAEHSLIEAIREEQDGK